MKFTPGTWRHKNFRDVDFWVVTVGRCSDGQEHLRGWWLRRDFGCGEFLLGDSSDDLWIKPSQFDAWSAVRGVLSQKV